MTGFRQQLSETLGMESQLTTNGDAADSCSVSSGDTIIGSSPLTEH